VIICNALIPAVSNMTMLLVYFSSNVMCNEVSQMMDLFDYLLQGVTHFLTR
jgi:hypothetical protein